MSPTSYQAAPPRARILTKRFSASQTSARCFRLPRVLKRCNAHRLHGDAGIRRSFTGGSAQIGRPCRRHCDPTGSSKGPRASISPSPVKVIAQREQIPVLQPTKMKDPSFMAEISGWNPDVIAVAAFGRILPPAILSLPPLGCINVHGSLLPKYRGAGPIQWALINGETETGITTMLMDEGMDTGAILLQATMAIGSDDTAGSLSSGWLILADDLLVKTLVQSKSGQADTSLAGPWPGDSGASVEKRRRRGQLDDVCHIDRQSYPRSHALAGGLYFLKDGSLDDLLEASLSTKQRLSLPARSPPSTKDAIHVATGKGVLAIRELQPANGRRMPAGQYLAGHPLEAGMRLSANTVTEAFKWSASHAPAMPCRSPDVEHTAAAVPPVEGQPNRTSPFPGRWHFRCSSNRSIRRKSRGTDGSRSDRTA